MKIFINLNLNLFITILLLLFPILAFFNFPIFKISLAYSVEYLQIFDLYFLVLLLFCIRYQLIISSKIYQLLQIYFYFLCYLLIIEALLFFFNLDFYFKNIFIIIKLLQLIFLIYVYYFFLTKQINKINIYNFFAVLALCMLSYSIYRLTNSFIWRLGLPFGGMSPNLMGAVCAFSLLHLLISRYILKLNINIFYFLFLIFTFLFVLLLSTSKTNILNFIFILVFFSLYIFWKENFYFFIKIFIIFLFILSIPILLFILNYYLSIFNVSFKYLIPLLDINNIINSGSLNNRIDHWFSYTHMLLQADNFIFRMFFGLSNSYMMDNNFLLLFFNYGLIGLILFLYLIFKVIKLNSIVLNFSLIFFLLTSIFSDYLFLGYKSWQIVVFFTVLLYLKEKYIKNNSN